MINSTIRRRLIGLRSIRYNTIRTYADKPHRSLFGDYPEVPLTYDQHKDPYVKYDDQQNRRNFNEPPKPYDELYDVWSPDRFDMVSDWVAIRNNLIFAAGIATFGAYIYYFAAPEKPAVPRQYPYDGLKKALGNEEYNKARVDEGA